MRRSTLRGQPISLAPASPPKVLLVPASLATLALLAVLDCDIGPAIGRTPAAPGLQVRPAAAAGRFYPGDPVHLAAAVDSFLADAVPPGGERPLGLIVPHAGYPFSGQIAADAFKQAAGYDYDLVVILGTNHTTAGFDQFSIHPGRAYETPLGEVAIDHQLALHLQERADGAVFRPKVHATEHSVEVQLPFVQRLFPGVPILPVVVASDDPERCARFGQVLAGQLADRHALIVASSDLSHYPGYAEAVSSDSAVLEAVASLEPRTVHQTAGRLLGRGSASLKTCACGEGAIMVLLAAARELGATRARLVSYANSGDTVLGDHERVVGYGAVAVDRGGGGPDLSGLPGLPAGTGSADAAAGQPLAAGDRRILLKLARRVLVRFLATETTPLVRGLPSVLDRPQGVFVTLRKHGALRGCIGHMSADRPLGQIVGTMAFQAAFQDRRFSPLRAGELPDLTVEVSLLTPLLKVAGPADIVVGRDGVLLRKSGRSAVFLPQVATEQGWDRQEMLGQLCRKAGLPAGAWRSGAEFWTFQAEVFGEE
jgi:AmmeMemoRadiSam system protein B/AmmeMemoRadiSam system protein A